MIRSMIAALAVCCTATAFAAEGAVQDAGDIKPRIAWYGTLKSGLAEAKRSGRPILLVSAAPHCTGVPGIW